MSKRRDVIKYLKLRSNKWTMKSQCASKIQNGAFNMLKYDDLHVYFVFQSYLL